MEKLQKKLTNLKQSNKQTTKIMIIGLGSVGLYLLDYVCSQTDYSLDIIVAGRNQQKMESDINIVRVSSLIRGLNRNHISIDGGCDLNDLQSVSGCIARHQPDIIINSSRVFAGLKYGSISWTNFRAYGIWSPLAVQYIRTIMQAVQQECPQAIVINTSYSDAVIPWLKSAGVAYPEFGSGNVNHLVPRIKFAAAQMRGISDYWNVDVRMATGHFHDVVISKEGQDEGEPPLLHMAYQGKELELDRKELFSRCKIAMPVDAKRNMMNASSDYDIIATVMKAITGDSKSLVHVPGAAGEIGGYPVVIQSSGQAVTAQFDQTYFTMEDMVRVNRRSLYLDGIEDVRNGVLYYTDELIAKVKTAFATEIPKQVPFDDIEKVAELLINHIILKSI